ncbi:ATPase with role in protein import into the ER [Tulasnella sp. 417]|nr:ATPase with role in protein import into the ER [Tulasnella sp. 417]
MPRKPFNAPNQAQPPKKSVVSLSTSISSRDIQTAANPPPPPTSHRQGSFSLFSILQDSSLLFRRDQVCRKTRPTLTFVPSQETHRRRKLYSSTSSINYSMSLPGPAHILLFERERAPTKDNDLLGNFDLSSISPDPRAPQTEVSVEIEPNAIPQIGAVGKGTGKSESIRIIYPKDHLQVMAKEAGELAAEPEATLPNAARL